MISRYISMKVIYVIAIASGLLIGAHGLRCWNCNNAKSQEECLKNGHSEQCQPGQQMSCATEIRHHGHGPLITKSCQQSLACKNNQRQNSQPAGDTTQCNSGKKNSVCRCCCKKFQCNKNKLCGPASPRCALLPIPDDGSKNCRYRLHEGEIGSKCTFSCDEGFLMNGKSVGVCRRSSARSKPKFNIPPPTCEELPPPKPNVTAIARRDMKLDDCSSKPPAPEGGGRSCISTGEGVVCSYFCGRQTTMVGTGIVLCTSVKGWDGWTPECEPRCPDLPPHPENGFRACDRDGEIGSLCEFFCNPDYEMLGSRSTECVKVENTAKWSPEPPKCKMPACPDLGSMEHGEIDCSGTSSHEVGTVCEFRCVGEGYGLRPRNRTQIECLPNVGWSDEMPCCSRTCPPHVEMDVVIIMDSSLSIRQKGWNIMTSIVMEVIGTFSISDTSAHFSVFRFNRRVDEETQILFGDFPNDIDGLLGAVEEIPYSGSGTYIGEALYHAKDTVMKSDNREHVKDMIWVLTDGISRDNVTKVSSELRKSGVEIFALGIPQTEGKVSMEQLLSIGGDEDHVYIVNKELSSAAEEIVNVVTENICDASCNTT